VSISCYAYVSPTQFMHQGLSRLRISLHIHSPISSHFELSVAGFKGFLTVSAALSSRGPLGLEESPWIQINRSFL
jgi:hypothetical protein